MKHHKGDLKLAIPKAESEVIDTDTTVECLAQFMVNEHQRLAPEQSYKVLAFEGVGKGGYAHA